MAYNRIGELGAFKTFRSHSIGFRFMIDMNSQLFETIMLLCFGSSWPFAVVKTLQTKVVNCKSIVFLFLIFSGYLSGITHKLIGDFDHVIWLYIVNGSMVLTEIILYFKYKAPLTATHGNSTVIKYHQIRCIDVDDTKRVLGSKNVA